MSTIKLINDSCANQNVDVVVNAANRYLAAGGGICGVIFHKAGNQLTKECSKHNTPLKDGDAVFTTSCNMTNCKGIIHAVGPDFGITPKAFNELHDAYYHSLVCLKDHGYHSISFPLISSGIFGGNLNDPIGESTKQCIRAYNVFTKDYPEYDIAVVLCAYTGKEYSIAKEWFNE